MRKRVLAAAGLCVILETGCGGVGEYTSLAIGGDGRGLISYQDTPNGLLKVAHCEDAACGTASLSTIDGGGENTRSVGAWTSAAIGIDGLGLISYVQGTDDLKVAHCEDTACMSARTSTLDARAGAAYTSLAIGRDGLGLIAYRNHFSGDLRVAHCHDIPCATATVSTLDRLQQVGEYSALAIGSDGLGLIAYHDRNEGLLKVAHCEDTACTSATLSTIENGPQVRGVSGYVGAHADVAIGSDGLGLISYYESPVGNLRVAHCADVACTRADAVTIIAAAGQRGRLGTDTSVTIGADGLGLISFKGSFTSFAEDDLMVAHCQDLACRSAIVTTLDRDRQNLTGWFTSAATGADGLGLISSWRPGPAAALRVAHCRDVDCKSADLASLDPPAR